MRYYRLAVSGGPLDEGNTSTFLERPGGSGPLGLITMDDVIECLTSDWAATDIEYYEDSASFTLMGEDGPTRQGVELLHPVEVPTLPEAIERLRDAARLGLMHLYERTNVADGDPFEVDDDLGRLFIDADGTVSIDLLDGSRDGFGNHEIGKAEGVLHEVWAFPGDHVALVPCGSTEPVGTWQVSWDPDDDDYLDAVAEALHHDGWGVVDDWSPMGVGYGTYAIAYKDGPLPAVEGDMAETITYTCHYCDATATGTYDELHVGQEGSVLPHPDAGGEPVCDDCADARGMI